MKKINKDMAKMKVYTQEESLDLSLGKKGTPLRDQYEAEMQDYLIGLAIREAREAQHLTQEQLGERIGVQRARICSIEKGVNLRLSTLRRVFKALGMEVQLNIGEMTAVPLC